ncbi:MAG TPA: hypothetical protein VNN62_08570 [Methylomirabilota bacterium]|nr:hypothetical protein [Methylomirabilota bacterium]
MDRPPDRWVTLEEAAREVHAPLSLVEQWVKEKPIAAKKDPVTHLLLVLFDDVEDVAEEEAFRSLSQRALAHEDRD